MTNLAQDPEYAASVLKKSKVVAVVGFSSNPKKPAYYAPMQLIERGFEVIAVNPNSSEIEGVFVVRSLAEIDKHVDLVDIFRPADEAAQITEQATIIGANAVWLQQGIVSKKACQIAQKHGLCFVENQCVKEIANKFDIHA